MISILLQMDYKLVATPSSSSIYIVIGIVVGIVFFFLIAYRASGGGIRRGGKKRFGKGAFHKQCRKIGLSKEQINSLEYLIKKYKFPNPFIIFTNPKALDNLLRRGMQEISVREAEESIKEAERLNLFRIKQAVERNSETAMILNTTRQLKANQKIIISPEAGGRYESVIVSNLKNAIAVEIPRNEKNELTRWNKWTAVHVYFWKSNGQSFSFNSKIMGYSKIKDTTNLLLQHSNSIQQAQQRQYRRKLIERPAYFSPVRVVAAGTGKNTMKKAVVDNRRSSLGNLIDISAGGCSLKSNRPLKIGELVKIDFETERKSRVTVYGKVRSVRRAETTGGIMHIMFTKISTTHMNKINSYVYDLAPVEVNY
ncbi:MAG: PilZ domain-containing protein [Spirochaetota bacterium]